MGKIDDSDGGSQSLLLSPVVTLFSRVRWGVAKNQCEGASSPAYGGLAGDSKITGAGRDGLLTGLGVEIEPLGRGELGHHVDEIVVEGAQARGFAQWAKGLDFRQVGEFRGDAAIESQIPEVEAFADLQDLLWSQAH